MSSHPKIAVERMTAEAPEGSVASQPKRIETVDALRGIAALAVAWFHFTNGNKAFLHDGALKWSGAYGWLGLYIFFVLSGFVIPYALHRAAFQPRQLGRFLLKRIIRLDPPYLATVAVVILLSYASKWTPGFKGIPFEFSWGQFLAHLGYANALIGYAWYNPVFWSLAIEFQWYLVAALLYPLFSSSASWKRWIVLGAFVLLPYGISSGAMLFRYLPLFGLGLAAFQHNAGLIRKLEYACLLITCGLILALNLGISVGLTGVGTALVVSFCKLRQRWLLGVGAISYSLYLLHVPIGGRVLNLSSRLPDAMWSKFAAVVLALLISLVAAFLLWKFVEGPAIRWAARIPSGKKSGT